MSDAAERITARDEHIAGVLVQTQTQHQATVQAAISGMPGTEVHAHDGAGKLVVTLQAADMAVLAQQIDAINQIRGVLAATLVYHHCEPLEAMQEEIPDDIHTT